MGTGRLIFRSLFHYARAHVALALACATTCAVLAGALVIGDSVRGSLRDRALERLGRIEYALVAPRFFRRELAGDLARDENLSKVYAPPAPACLLRAATSHPESGRRAAGVQLIGLDERFAPLAAGGAGGPKPWLLEGRNALINETLARELGARPGDTILLRFEKTSDVPGEHALGRRSGTTARLRLELAGILEDRGLGVFDLRHQQLVPKNVFVPLDLVAEAAGRPGRANALFVGGGASTGARPPPQAALKRRIRLADLGLKLRVDPVHAYCALESEEFLLSRPAAQLAREAARAERLPIEEVLTYLANAIRAGEREIPYSTVTAAGPWTFPDGRTAPPLAGTSAELWKPGGIILNSWAANDLKISPPQRVELRYWAVRDGEELEEESATFELTGVVPLEGDALDPRWTPEYPGITDAATFADWDAPFPIDHSKIREPGPDGDYWKRYSTTPKAFITLEDGKRLWGGSRFGELTSVRVRADEGRSLEEAAAAFRKRLREEIPPERFGLVFRPVRKEALEAAESGTDFAGLFLALSSFITVSALLLAAMSVRLALERRSREIGMLSALGWGRRRILLVLLGETGSVALAGALAGVPAALGYAALVVHGLKTWWRGAANAPFLALHVEGRSLVLGAVVTAAVSCAVLAWVLRRVVALGPKRLLAGALLGESRLVGRGRARVSLAVAGAAFFLGAASLAAAFAALLDLVTGFFAAAAFLLAGGLALFAWWLRRERPSALSGRGVPALLRLGCLNARRVAGRSLLTAGLLACAVFVLVTVAASRRDPARSLPSREGGDGGFSLFATSAVPLLHPLSSAEGRDELGLSAQALEWFEDRGLEAYEMRVRPGDEASCLNLYRPQVPRLLGAPDRFLARGGFSWSGSSARTEEERVNPWLILRRRDWPEGVVPAVADWNTAEFILHVGLGEELELLDETGAPVRLRIVALLAHSIFQGDLVIPEWAFTKHFPRRVGWSAFLFELPLPEGKDPDAEAQFRKDVEAVESGLERDLSDYGFDARPTWEILRAFQQVENTYLSTFYALGGLGVLLGTLGLGAVLLRNVEERRGELALLRAVGYSRRALGFLVLAETVWLLLFGLGLGAVTAVVAVLPSAREAGTDVAWGGLAGTLAAVFATGVLSASLALRRALRAPLIETLRRE